MAADWKARFVHMVAELQKNQRILVKQAIFHPPAAAEELEAAQELINGTLPDGCQHFYEQMNGFKLQWETAADDDGAIQSRGSINLLPVAQVFASWQGAVRIETPIEGMSYSSIKPFDLYAPESCAAFSVTAGQKAEPGVFFHYFGEGTVRTGYCFEEYLELLLMSRGYWNWIQALSVETNDNPEAVAFHEAAPLLFEDFEGARFSPR